MEKRVDIENSEYSKLENCEWYDCIIFGTRKILSKMKKLVTNRKKKKQRLRRFESQRGKENVDKKTTYLSSYIYSFVY